MNARRTISLSGSLAAMLVAGSATAGGPGASAAPSADRIAHMAGRLEVIDRAATAAALRAGPGSTRTVPAVRFRERVLGIPGTSRSISALKAGRIATRRLSALRRVDAQAVDVSFNRYLLLGSNRRDPIFRVEPRTGKSAVKLRNGSDWSTFMQTAAVEHMGAEAVDLERPYAPGSEDYHKAFAGHGHARLLHKLFRNKAMQSGAMGTGVTLTIWGGAAAFFGLLGGIAEGASPFGLASLAVSAAGAAVSKTAYTYGRRLEARLKQREAALQLEFER